MKSCAIELAEAEQSLAFLRNACCVSRDKVYQCKRKIERLEKCIMDFTEDRETTLTLKMNQMCIQPEDCPTTSRNEDAVSTPRTHLMRTNPLIEKVRTAQRKRSLALREFHIMNNIVLYQAFRRECEYRMRALQKYKENLKPMKVKV